MGYTQVALIDKILEMYPEIIVEDISPSLRFDKNKDTWIVNLRKGNLEFSVCLDKEDADACIEFNRYCKTFGEELGKIIRIMERTQSS